jgi:hypothetical protein
MARGGGFRRGQEPLRERNHTCKNLRVRPCPDAVRWDMDAAHWRGDQRGLGETARSMAIEAIEGVRAGADDLRGYLAALFGAVEMSEESVDASPRGHLLARRRYSWRAACALVHSDDRGRPHP